MAPEEFWSRQDIVAATNAVTEARARLQAKITANLADEMKAAQAQAGSTQILDDAKSVVQKQVEEANVTDYVTPLEPLPNAADLAAASVATAIFSEDAVNLYDIPAEVDSSGLEGAIPAVPDLDESLPSYGDQGS